MAGLIAFVFRSVGLSLVLAPSLFEGVFLVIPTDVDLKVSSESQPNLLQVDFWEEP